ncbi:MAG: hypothetical protein GQF41_3281 [Candidatus Rifleibacterium amylolyticum]|nr:MAG: hypothetical protein GQF41_3281 [Candidatus Rifleibacterium amylolyticum]
MRQNQQFSVRISVILREARLSPCVASAQQGAGEVAETTFSLPLWILRLRFAPRRMTNKKVKPQNRYHC